MGQTVSTRQGDWLALPTISGANRAGAIAVAAVAGYTDLHSGRTLGVDSPNGHVITIKNEGATAAYLVLDSASGGTAASSTNGVRLDAGQSMSAMLMPGWTAADGTSTYPSRYLKHIGDGGATTLKWWISTNYQVT